MEDQAVAIPEDPKELQTLARSALERAQAVTITTAEDYAAAGEMRNGYTKRAEMAEKLLRPGVEEAFRHHKNLLATLNACVNPWIAGAKAIKQMMIAYDQEQERRRKIEQARLEAEAKKKAEEEALELAALLEEAGLKEEAEQTLTEPPQVTTPVIPKQTPKVENFSYREIWKVEIEDVAAMLEGWKAGKIPADGFSGNETYFRQEAGRLKTLAIGKWPGVKVWSEKV